MVQNRPSTYKIDNAKIQDKLNPEYVIVPSNPAWLSILIWSGLFTLLGLFIILLGGKSVILLGFVVAINAVIFPATLPLTIQVSFNFFTKQVTLNADYLLRRPRHVELSVPFSQIARLDFRAPKSRIVDVLTVDGAKFILSFGRRDEAKMLVDKFASLAGSEAAPILNAPEAVKVANISGAQALMQRELRSWSIWLLVLGVIQMVAAGGFSSWGLLLIGVGLASFYFREPAMFIIYAATIAWAGISNFFYGSATTWNIFALFQLYLTYAVFKQFQRFQKAEQEAKQVSGAGPETPGRSERLFPWLSAFLGIGALLAYALTWGIAFACALLHISMAANSVAGYVIDGLGIVAVYAAILALATGLAGWISAFQNKWASILGTVVGGLTLVVSLVVSLLLKS
ncbi:MAG: hypothetical protein WA821_06820 [Anaerolineales bacterium]